MANHSPRRDNYVEKKTWDEAMKSSSSSKTSTKSTTDAGTDKPRSEMTVAQLKAYAAEKGYDLGDVTKKDDIVAAIDLAEENEARGNGGGENQTPAV